MLQVNRQGREIRRLAGQDDLLDRRVGLRHLDRPRRPGQPVEHGGQQARLVGVERHRDAFAAAGDVPGQRGAAGVVEQNGARIAFEHGGHVSERDGPVPNLQLSGRLQSLQERAERKAIEALPRIDGRHLIHAPLAPGI